VRLEAMNSFRVPAMFERPVQLQPGFLQLHSRRPRVGRPGPPTDEAVNFFFEVDEWLFHAAKAYAFAPANASGA
jgi:hypothetical protein